jgi:hypothetical protein
MRGLNIKELVIESIERLLRPNFKCHYVLEEDWDVLIILDACRYDVFSHHFQVLGSKGKLEHRISCGSHTAEFVRKNFLRKEFLSLLRKIVYVSANPMVDAALGKVRKHFYKYIPIWRFAWDEHLVTVSPWRTAYYALKTYLATPKDKKIIVHFLQPHGPFIGKKYGHISKYFNKEVNEFIKRHVTTHIERRKDNIILSVINFYIKPIIKEGILNGFPQLGRLYSIEDLIKAYIENLLITFPYVKILLESFSGRIVVTSDHGEAFGEYISKIVPIRVVGHFSRIHSDVLVKIPWYTVENSIDYQESLRRTLRNILKLRLKEVQ